MVAFVGCHGGMCATHHDSPDVAMEMKRRAKLQYGFNVRMLCCCAFCYLYTVCMVADRKLEYCGCQPAAKRTVVLARTYPSVASVI